MSAKYETTLDAELGGILHGQECMLEHCANVRVALDDARHVFDHLLFRCVDEQKEKIRAEFRDEVLAVLDALRMAEREIEDASFKLRQVKSTLASGPTQHLTLSENDR